LPFETAIIKRYRRRESSVEEALVEMNLAGVSVRRVEDITEALWGTRVSSGTVSRLNQKIYRHIESWRKRKHFNAERHCIALDSIELQAQNDRRYLINCTDLHSLGPQPPAQYVLAQTRA
jgi:putative transposase